MTFGIDDVFVEDEVAEKLEDWAYLKQAEACEQVAGYMNAHRARARKNRDDVAILPVGDRISGLSALSTQEQRLWYKFHGQMQAYEKAARVLEEQAASHRLRAEL